MIKDRELLTRITTRNPLIHDDLFVTFTKAVINK